MLLKYLLIFILPFIICSCTTIKNKGQNSVNVELFYSIQVVKMDKAELVTFKDSLSIYKIDSNVIYKCPVLNLLTKRRINKGKDTVFEEEENRTITYRYIVYRENDKLGYLYDSLQSLKPNLINVDSFQRAKVLKGFPFYIPTRRLISSVKSKDGKLLIEKRIPVKVIDESYADTCYYYYTNKYKDAPYTFSNNLDSIQQLKLYKVRYLYNLLKKGKYPVDMPKREFYFELRKAKPAPEISILLERFKAMKTK